LLRRKSRNKKSRSVGVIAEIFGKTRNSIKQKMLKMGLVEEQHVKKSIVVLLAT
jgi:hypothetical protein